MDFLIIVGFGTGLILMSLVIVDRGIYIAMKNKKLRKKINKIEQFLLG